MIKDYILNETLKTIKKLVEQKKLGALEADCELNLNVGIPKNVEFGDFAVNVSSLSRFTKMSPAQTAEIITSEIISDDFDVNFIGGFINFKLKNSALNNIILEIMQKKSDFAKNDYGEGKKVILEYVSANPTGPFHIGHGRWAAMGSALANVLKYAGYNVYQEFYINDAGVQIKNLGRSLHIRILQEMGINAVFPTDEIEAKKYYAGDYLIPTAKKFVFEKNDFAKTLTKTLTEEQLVVLSDYAKKEMLEMQKKLLSEFHTSFDNFYSETQLHQSGEVEKCVQKLRKKNMLYEKEDAIWFKSSAYTDEQDRVIKKSDGTNTYLTADIAYHYDKLKRGFDVLINIWGADHHGYIPRIKAAIDALDYNSDCLEVLLGQLVNLLIKGEQMRMGKRKNMITLQDLIDEVGVDATRFWMIMRSIDTALDFDVELAKSSSDDNPVFYVQYAHARSCSIFRNAISKRIDTQNKTEIAPMFSTDELEKVLDNQKNSDYDILWEQDEKSQDSAKKLILKLEDFKSVILNSAKNRAPYLLCNYAQELAGIFHQFYSVSRVLSGDKKLTQARLALVKATTIILEKVLNILAVSAPEKM